MFPACEPRPGEKMLRPSRGRFYLWEVFPLSRCGHCEATMCVSCPPPPGSDRCRKNRGTELWLLTHHQCGINIFSNFIFAVIKLMHVFDSKFGN